ncbi:MAG: hypothetical protein AB7R89_09435 [Dehalococcoidia bacterium]
MRTPPSLRGKGAGGLGIDDLNDAITEATAAFDAANHAFGRFVTYAVRPHNQPIPPEVQRVREALQEAAICVPRQPTTDEARAFLDALRAAYDVAEQFLAEPPGRYAVEEVRPAPDALDEAIQVLEAALRSIGE